MRTKTFGIYRGVTLLLLVWLVSFHALPASAKQMTRFSVTPSQPEVWQNVAGWNCKMEPYAGYTETLKNTKGIATARQTFNNLKAGSPGGAAIVEVTAQSTSSDLGLGYFEKCSTIETVIVMVPQYDDKGNMSMVGQVQTNVYSAWAKWDCGSVPAGQVESSRDCKLAAAPYSDSQYSGYQTVLNHLFRNGEHFTMKVASNAKSERYLFDNCTADHSQRKIIQMRQGVEGNWFDNRFLYYILLNGKLLKQPNKDFSYKSPDGMIDEEIAYCPAPGEKAGPVKVGVFVKSLSPLSRHLYVSGHDAQLGENGGKCDDKIRLHRTFGLFGPWRGQDVALSLLPNDQNGCGHAPEVATNQRVIEKSSNAPGSVEPETALSSALKAH